MFKRILAIGAALCMLCGCGATPGESTSDPPAAETRLSTLPAREIAANEYSDRVVQVAEFDLGAGQYSSKSGKTMPYRLRGVIGLPEGEGPFPLVLLSHGSHGNLDETLRFDTGLTYLVNTLAQNGYIALSLDMSSAYLWKYGDSDSLEKSAFLTDLHIKSLQSASKGDSGGYGMNIKDRIDWERVALAGHSRGGEAALLIAEQQRKKGLEIGAVLAVAPTQPADAEELEWPECPISILVPEYDGDVVSLDGFGIDAVLGNQPGRLHAVTYLLGGNHNYFNTSLTENDALLARGQDELENQLSPIAQQSFLASFAVDFFNATLKEQPEGTLYAADAPQPQRMYGQPVVTRLRTPTAMSADISAGYTTSGLTAKAVDDSWFYSEDEAAIDTVTFGDGAHKVRKLLELSWQDRSGVASFMPPKPDISAHAGLSLDLTVNHADPANADGQSFSVELADRQGGKAVVTLPSGLNALRSTPGRLESTNIYGKDYAFWTPVTPIGSVRIPLDMFEGVDLTQVASVKLLFDQTGGGSLYLQGISVI